ncbi:NADH-ubiquinone oxidoreductase-F iron-sulfur binding region domain-containing protein [Dethiobacter alkaliphilus]|uniref:NADH-ubiquinone oxidoreductase-F iron-sulfur binding region domain-containing protein n=1 Tax=Dethiobacter alkaliphilus TaxID=427926 RepID=UPI002225F263|nr:NADH-ubiquinone oxidoreductase-F iron-sulfur binding region domain-containing protein [Dethiobacter alkaliphilus]MCW3489246.1 NADH-quinone oxidoreductase subunit F [Dethiobacter alkaliphilus]
MTKFELLVAEAKQRIDEKQGTTLVCVGVATCSMAAGALKVKDAFISEIQRKELDARVIEVGCMGHCYAEPLVLIKKPGFPALLYGKLDEDLVERLVEDFLANEDPCFDFALAAIEPNDFFPTLADFPRGFYEEKLILEQCGFINPEDIDHYLAAEGYCGLVGALDKNPADVIEEVKSARLRGRGGAGFPAGVKWEKCSRQDENEKYVVCNADEGDPGAFMDRAILESNPHLVLEGMAICGYAVGASKGYIYVRAEYPKATSRLRLAISQAKEKGLLGKNILGSGFSFDIEIFEGSGAFVCGEGTALINSMAGKMGIPETRPPRMAVSGLYGKPTVLNNVKTFAYVPGIVKNGAHWFRQKGTEQNPGTAVFALVGKIKNSGLVEVPMGTTLRRLIYDVGEGIPNDKKFKAVQIGGPSGGCLPEDALDIPIDFDSLHDAGAIMGSGGLVVLDENDCMVTVARYFLEFTQHESCGKCTFCRLGTKHMLDILTAITQGKGSLSDLDLLLELAEDVRDGSLCNLGGTAPNPVLTTLRYFRDEYEAHLEEGRCPARMCKDLIAYYIVPQKCSKLCSACVGSCPTEAIYTREDGIKAITQDKCVKCDNCLKACPPEYDAVEKLSPPVLPGEKGSEKK